MKYAGWPESFAARRGRNENSVRSNASLLIKILEGLKAAGLGSLQATWSQTQSQLDVSVSTQEKGSCSLAARRKIEGCLGLVEVVFG